MLMSYELVLNNVMKDVSGPMLNSDGSHDLRTLKEWLESNIWEIQNVKKIMADSLTKYISVMKNILSKKNWILYQTFQRMLKFKFK